MSTTDANKPTDQLDQYVDHYRRFKDGSAMDQMRLEWELSPLGNGRHAKKFAEINDRIIAKQSLLSKYTLRRRPPFEHLDETNSIEIGYESLTGEPVRFPLILLCRHTLLNAPTGRGKTTFQRHLAQCLLKFEVKQIHSDPKGDLRCLAQIFSRDAVVLPIQQNRSNPLSLSGGSRPLSESNLVDIARAYRIRPETIGRMVSSLREQLGNEPTEVSCEQVLRRMRTEARRRRDKPLEASAGILDQYVSAVGRAASVITGPSILDVAERIIVLDRTDVDVRTMEADAAVLLNELLTRGRADGYDGSLQRLVFFDEATFLFRKQSVDRQQAGFPSVQERLLTQIRATGNGLVLATQQLASVSDLLQTNCATFICLGATNYEEATKSARLLGLPPERSEELRDLDLGEAFIRCPAYRDPIRFRFPYIPAGPVPSRSWVAQHMSAKWRTLDEQTRFENEPATTEPDTLSAVDASSTAPVRPPTQNQVLTPWVNLLADVSAHPDSSLTERYRRLGLSGSRGHRLRTKVVDAQLVTLEREQGVSRRPKELMRLTDLGRDFLQKNQSRCSEEENLPSTSE